MANGNTLITNVYIARLIEVTPDGEIVCQINLLNFAFIHHREHVPPCISDGALLSGGQDYTSPTPRPFRH